MEKLGVSSRMEEGKKKKKKARRAAKLEADLNAIYDFETSMDWEANLEGASKLLFGSDISDWDEDKSESEASDNHAHSSGEGGGGSGGGVVGGVVGGGVGDSGGAETVPGVVEEEEMQIVTVSGQGSGGAARC
jgi:hypothetical protein